MQLRFVGTYLCTYIQGTLKPTKSNSPIGTPSKSIKLKQLVQVQAKFATSTYGSFGFESCDQLGDSKVEGINLGNDDINEDSSYCNQLLGVVMGAPRTKDTIQNVQDHVL